ncbi:hypothetical protein Hamer_G021192 [Homarus americanus]|uniref:Uncharacterized protein n=1 Tax=Homarus americanus TaxID=6706 RepID=A0A8J5J9H7_HOMAM|nr:hypothetical protein Hamer_G021192 [Homarus americanus]
MSGGESEGHIQWLHHLIDWEQRRSRSFRDATDPKAVPAAWRRWRSQNSPLLPRLASDGGGLGTAGTIPLLMLSEVLEMYILWEIILTNHSHSVE